MPIVAADIVYRLAVTTGPGNSTAQPDPNISFGEFMSTTVAATTLDGMFDQISGAENTALDVEYRCVFVYNTHATLTLQAAKLWLSAEVAGGADAAIALDPAGVVVDDLATAQALEIVDEEDSGDALSGLTFSAPTTEGAALSIGDIPAGSAQALWVRRTATDSPPEANDGVTLRVKGDTAA